MASNHFDQYQTSQESQLLLLLFFFLHRPAILSSRLEKDYSVARFVFLSAQSNEVIDILAADQKTWV